MFRLSLLFLALVLAVAAPVSLSAQAVTVDTPRKGQQPVTPTPPAAQPSAPAPVAIRDPGNTLFLDTEYGRVVIELRPDLAPKTVARIKELTRRNFYDGLKFHRVLDGFMAQTGDPKGDGTGGSGKKLPAEFSRERHVRGTVSMARAADPDSADSQFFICTGDAAFLDGQYTVFGHVIHGIESIDRLKKGPRANNGMVDKPDHIVQMRIATDVR